MKKYELLVVLPGTLEEKEAEAKTQEILNWVTERRAENGKLNILGKSRLAYPINQIRYGYFYTLTFEMEPSEVRALEENLRLRRDILRTMISYFNTELTASQRIAYTTNNLGVTTMLERPGSTPAPEAFPRPVPVAKKEEKEVDMADITKKLEAILSGEDIIPGV